MDSKTDVNIMASAAVEAHRGPILSVIKNLIRDPFEAEDILQDVFEEFVEAYELGLAIETVGAWMTKVAKNKVIDRFRRRKIQEEYRLLVQAEDQTSVAPLDPAIQEELRQEITLAIEALPDDQREVFILHELEGKSFEEIATLTGQSMNTLLSRKRYAVLALREYLQEVYDETF